MSVNVSIVIPVYFNEGSIFATYNTISEEVISKWTNKTFELIFVDDGSGDRSLEEMQELYQKNPEQVKLIKFSRNFGQLAAIMAAYKMATGDCIINISADLQDPPELMNDMIKCFYEQGTQIVIGTRQDRDESWYRKQTSRFFYSLIKKLSFKNMPVGGFDFALISAKVRDTLLDHFEANSFWQGQLLWTGFPVMFIPYMRRKRELGQSRWTFGKKMKYLIDGVMGYSYWPLRAMSVMGLIFFILGLLYALFITISYFLGNIPFKGWAPIMILILVLSGIQMLMLGILGEYLWRTLDQVRNRPTYIIDKIYNNKTIT